MKITIFNVDDFDATPSARRPRDQIEIGITPQQSRYVDINEIISPSRSS